jgi:hypothetical protein
MIKNGIEPFSWTKEPTLDSFKQLEKYNLVPQLTKNVENCETISDFFNFFINDQMIENIVSSTNKKILKHALKIKIKNQYLSPVTKIEIRGFIGLLILFGLLKKHDAEISRIWSTESVHSCHIATATMARERFQIISVCLTFDDIESREIRKPMCPKFYKINEYFGMFRDNIQSAFIPGAELCVDETLLVTL